MTETALTPARLWKTMTATQRMAAARAFWLDEQATDDQIQAAMLIAQQKKFRPKTVIGLDIERKSRHLASIVNLPESLAARALIVYHLAEQRPMMAAFLDALGLAHEDGLIQEENVQPDAAEAGAGGIGDSERLSRRRRVALPEHAGLSGSADVGRAGEDDRASAEFGARPGSVTARLRAVTAAQLRRGRGPRCENRSF